MKATLFFKFQCQIISVCLVHATAPRPMIQDDRWCTVKWVRCSSTNFTSATQIMFQWALMIKRLPTSLHEALHLSEQCSSQGPVPRCGPCHSIQHYHNRRDYTMVLWKNRVEIGMWLISTGLTVLLNIFKKLRKLKKINCHVSSC